MTRKITVVTLNLVCIVLCLSIIVPVSMPAVTASGTASAAYNPWADINNDGRVNILDLIKVAISLGTSGTPITKASVQFDSGWLNITGKCGEYITINHDLNSTNIIVDIQGKTTIGSGIHQKYFGLTDHLAGWNRIYRGANIEAAFSIIQTSDGGYALAGTTLSLSGGSDDVYLVKTDVSGNMEWNKTYGGAGADSSSSIIQTSDGGYALAGYTTSFGAGNADAFLVKADSSGNMIWNKTYGGTGDDEAYSLIQTNDGGYALAGYTNSFGAGGYDALLVKTDGLGNLQRELTYGGAGNDRAYSIVQTNDGGYALAGYTDSYGSGRFDAYLVKTDDAGNMKWSKTYGGTDNDYSYSVAQTSDGGYALAGYTNSFGAGGYDCYLVKTNSNGTMEWSRTYGGAQNDYCYSVVQTSDGGYSLVGTTASFSGSYDAYLVKTDASGNVQWSRTYGGTGIDEAYSIVQTSDGGYVLAGDTATFGASNGAFYLVKTEVESGLAWTNSTSNTLTLYRGLTDPYWNFVRVRVWQTNP